MRLFNLAAGDRFTFICSAGQEAGIIKIVAHGNGRIVERRQESGGIVMTVCRNPSLRGE